MFLTYTFDAISRTHDRRAFYTREVGIAPVKGYLTFCNLLFSLFFQPINKIGINPYAGIASLVYYLSNRLPKIHSPLVRVGLRLPRLAVWGV